ncbi:glycosyltransferase family 2 protein, partial [Stella sp.]|uniref:glycosyltransferase family 2 protein n=1 Tax=Stella sp. TaxID=2912054 RepID=UPI0035AD9879
MRGSRRPASTEPAMPLSGSSASLAICAIAKNEASYLLEWVAAHFLAGVEHIRVYDNESTDGTGVLLSALARHYPVEPVHWPTIEGRSPHHSALADGYAQLRGRFAFVAAIDLDEFLFAASGASLADWFGRLDPTVGAVGVNQLVFGSSGEREFRPDLVISRFTRRKPDGDPEHHFVKSIVRPELVAKALAHRAEIIAGRYVHCDGSELAATGDHPGRADRIVIDDVRLHHYILKSAEEFEAKRGRGDAAAPTIAQRFRRYGPRFFATRDETANRQIDETLAARADRVQELVMEMAGRIAGRVGRDRLRTYYEFLRPPLAPEVPAAARPDHEPAPAPSRPRLYVHIGLHKTGTTSIQAYLSKHRDRLAAAGVYVPLIGVAPGFDGHHLLPWSISRPNSEHLTGVDPDALWTKLRSEFDACGNPFAIVSSEEFSGMRDDDVERFGRLLDGYEIVPIVILRRPGDVLEGGFRTHIVSGGSGPLERFVGNSPRPYHDYFPMLMRWRRLPGVSAMMIG